MKDFLIGALCFTAGMGAGLANLYLQDWMEGHRSAGYQTLFWTWVASMLLVTAYAAAKML